MGVYHFMGLGLSPGAVTSAISYLADRYVREHESDKEFFSTSGSSEAPPGERRGYIEALVLFSTREIRTGTTHSKPYIDNIAGQTRGDKRNGDKMKRVLRQFLPRELKRIAGGRSGIPVYWCDVDHTNPRLTFERVARVMYAAKKPDKTGKEMWINLTGGNNVVNMALQLATSLLGHASRIYYLLSDNDSCLRHTTPKNFLGVEGKDRFWVPIPTIFLKLDRVQQAILEVLEQAGGELRDEELWELMHSHPVVNTEYEAPELSDITTLRRNYLNRMGDLISQNLNDKHLITLGEQWKVLKDYYEIVTKLGRPDTNAEHTLEGLVAKHKELREQNEDWFEQEIY